MTGTGKNIAKVRLLKKLGLIGLSAASLTIAIVAAFAFLPKTGGVFSIRVDDPTKTASHFVMSTGAHGGGEGDVPISTYIRGTPANNMKTTSAAQVEKKLAKLDEEGLAGPQNLMEDGGSHTEAIVLVAYLKNTSNENVTIKYNVDLDGYSSSNGTADIYDYVRVLMRSSIEGSDELPSNVYYANHRTNYRSLQYRTELEGTAQDENLDINENPFYREMISTYKLDTTDITDEYIVSTFSSNGNDGYCISFSDYRINNTSSIISGRELQIPANQTMRVTFATYFEGYDPDCSGNQPMNSQLLLSLHFGI